MSNREQIWRSFVERSEGNASVRKTLEEIEKLEEIGDKHEFDAANLKLPYASSEEGTGAVWK